MTYEEKINWLFRYREAERLYQRLSYRLAEAQEATRHITQNLSAAPGGSKDGQSLARAVEREEEAERRAYAQLAVLMPCLRRSMPCLCSWTPPNTALFANTIWTA